MLEVGQTVKGAAAEYRCDAKLDEVTFAGTRTRDRAPVLFKVLRGEDAKAVTRLERERAVLRSLANAHVPALYETFEKDGTRVLVEQWIAGDSLATKSKRGDRFTAGQADKLVRGMLALLRYLHERTPPVVHGEIDASKILVAKDDTPSLVGFGGARGAEGDPRTDLDALGETLREAFAGSELPPRVQSVLDALAARRPSTALEALALLDATPPTPLRRAAAAALALVGVGLLALVVMKMNRVADEPPPTPPPAPIVAKPAEAGPAATIVRSVASEWTAHVKTAEGVALPKNTSCVVRAETRLVLERKDATPEPRVAHLVVRCGADTVHEQRTDELRPSVADEEPGDAPGTYRLALTIFARDGDTLLKWNGLQRELELQREGEKPLDVRLYVDELSAAQTTPLYEDAKGADAGALVPHRTLHGRVDATTGTPPASAKTGASCELEARPTWRFRDEGRAKNCDVSLFCGDEYVFADATECSEAEPLKLDVVSFRGVGQQRHELHVDAAAKSARFSEKEGPYTLSIRLE